MDERRRDNESIKLLIGVMDDLDHQYFNLQDINDVFGVYTSTFERGKVKGDRGLFQQDSLDCLVEMGCVEPVDDTSYRVVPNILERYLRE